ncbi:unnamed protein product [Closterium sp. NIES-64]|nr:unnamed protein product [Closterium sp. NIES-64]
MCTSCVMAGIVVAVRKIARGANAHASAGIWWRGRRGGLSARRGGRPSAQIWSLSCQIAEEEEQSEKDVADLSLPGWEVTRGGRMRATGLMAMVDIAGTRERIARRKKVTAVAKSGVAGVAWRSSSLVGRETSITVTKGAATACAHQAGDSIVMEGTQAARARRISSRHAKRGAKTATARLIRGRCVTRGAEAGTARLICGDAETKHAEAVRTRQICGDITAGGAKEGSAHQIRIAIMMRDAGVAVTRLMGNGIMKKGGKARRARRIGVSDMTGEAGTARRSGSKAGRRGRAAGLARLGGIGSVVKNVMVKRNRINAAAEWGAAG